MTKRVTVAVVLVSVLMVRDEARAQQPGQPPPMERPGLDIGVRLGYALPFGKVRDAAGATLSDGISGAIPLVLEAGYRVNRNVTVGALVQYGFAQVKENMTTGCGGAVSCSSTVVRLGLEALYRIDVSGLFVPWLGLGAGYEWFGIDGSSGAQSASLGAHGFEFVTLQGGGEYRLAPQATVGPFLSFSIARFDTTTFSGGGMDTSTTIQNKALHEWLQFGARGTFNL